MLAKKRRFRFLPSLWGMGIKTGTFPTKKSVSLSGCIFIVLLSLCFTLKNKLFSYSFLLLEIALQWENFSTESEVSGEAENGNSNRLATEDNGNVDNNDNSDVNRSNEAGSEFIPPRVYDDDTLQRKLELRESKICDLIRKQEGLLQTIEKMSSKPLPKDKSRLILDGDLHCGQLKGF